MSIAAELPGEADPGPTRAPATADEPDAEREHLDRVLHRAGTSWLRLMTQLHESDRELAALVAARLDGPWTYAQHMSYLRLRKGERRLERRVRRTRQVFDRVRMRQRDLDAQL